MASGLFAMVSLIVAGADNDPGRIAAQVVTGIGFLGAGTIMRHGSTVKGLTTAASLWMAAALGLAAGFGWYEGAAATAVLAFLVLTVVKVIEDRLPRLDPAVSLLVRARPGGMPFQRCCGCCGALARRSRRSPLAMSRLAKPWCTRLRSHSHQA